MRYNDDEIYIISTSEQIYANWTKNKPEDVDGNVFSIMSSYILCFPRREKMMKYSSPR